MQVDQTIQQTEAIVRFTEEVDRRLAEHGFDGAGELLTLYHQLREALGGLDLAELEWAFQETVHLERRLQDLGTELQHLSALKTSFEAQH